MRSINLLYNACHIKCYYDCGLESVSAVLKLAWFQDSHAALGPPPASLNLSMGAIHACWCVSECKFERGSCALSWTSPALAGQTPGTDSQKFHSAISEAVSELSVWLTALIKQHSIVVRITLLNNTGVIPSNRPAESWITPDSLCRSAAWLGSHCDVRWDGKTGSWAPLSFLWWNLEWLHMFGELLKPVCQKHTLTNCQTLF